MAETKLTESQRQALTWVFDQGGRTWHGSIVGDPPIGTLMSLVRRGFLQKTGSAGWKIRFERLPLGREALLQSKDQG